MDKEIPCCALRRGIPVFLKRLLMILVLISLSVNAALLTDVAFEWRGGVGILKLYFEGKYYYRFYREGHILKVWDVVTSVDFPKEFYHDALSINVYLQNRKLTISSNYPMEAVKTSYGLAVLVKTYLSGIKTFKDASIYEVASWLTKLGYNVVFSGEVLGHVTAKVDATNINFDALFKENGFPYSISGNTITVYPKNMKEEQVVEMYLRDVTVRELITRFEKILKVPIEYPKSLSKKRLFFVGKDRVYNLLKKLASILECDLERTNTGFKLVPYASQQVVKVFAVDRPDEVAKLIKTVYRAQAQGINGKVVVRADKLTVKKVEDLLEKIAVRIIPIKVEIYVLKGISDLYLNLSFEELKELAGRKMKLILKEKTVLADVQEINYRAFSKRYTLKLIREGEFIKAVVYLKTHSYKTKVANMVFTREHPVSYFRVEKTVFVVRLEVL